MNSPNPSTADDFAGLRNLLISGASTVTLLVVLFGGLLQSLAPPEESAVLVGWMSLLALVVLGGLSIMVRYLRSTAAYRLAAAGSTGLALLSTALFFVYVYTYRQYTFQVPPPPAVAVQKFVRGDVHEQGRMRLKSMSVDTYASTDLEAVLSTEVLWTQSSRNWNRLVLDVLYVTVSSTMAAALFLGFLALQKAGLRSRSQNTKKV